MTEEEEFEFRLRLEKEKGVVPAQVENTPVNEDLAQVAGHPAARFASGAMAAPIGATQLAANALDSAPLASIPLPLQMMKGGMKAADVMTGKKNVVSEALNQKIREYETAKQQGRADRGSEGFDWAELAGMATTPMGLARGAAIKLPETAGRVTKALAMGAEGAGYGLSMPATGEDFAQEKVTQALMGGGFGLGAGSAAEVGKMAGNWAMEGIKPLYKKGIQSDIAKYIGENFDAGKDKVVAALRGAMPDETAAQAVSRANKEALARGQTVPFGRDVVTTEKALAKTKGGAGLMSKPNQQEFERQAIIGDIARTDWEEKLATGIRSQVGSKKYQDAFNASIKGDPELAQIASNPYFKKGVKKAGELMKANPDEPQTLTSFLHIMKMELDAKLAAPKGSEKAIAGKERSTVQKLKKQVVGWIEKKNPLYADARITHQELSVPINRMQVGKELQDALRNSKEDETLVNFLNAIRNAPQKIKSATKSQIYDDYGQIVSPEQKTGIDIVTESLKNKAFQEGKKMQGENLLKNLSYEVEFRLPHILSRPIVVTNAILSRLGHSKGPEYQKILAEVMDNPQKLADYMELPKTSPLQKKAQVIVDYLNNVGAMQASQSGEQ